MIRSWLFALLYLASLAGFVTKTVTAFAPRPLWSSPRKLYEQKGSNLFSSSPTSGTASGAKIVAGSEEDAESPADPETPSVQRSYRLYEWEHEGQVHQINYRVEGPHVDDERHLQPVLLVHGFGANVNHFRHQFPALQQEGYRVYALDLIGFGASDKPGDVPYSIELFVQLLHDFVHAMNERYHSSRTDETVQWMVAGNSIGGLCCLCLAKELPQHVQGVVLFNCAGGMSGFRYEDVPLFVRPILYLVQNVVLQGSWGSQFFSDFKTAENVERILREQGVYQNQTYVDDELLELLLGPSDDEGAETVFLKVFGGPPGPTPESILPGVQCPILAVWGETDPWTPYDKGAHPATEMQQLHFDFQLTVLPDTGHCPHDERPDQVHAHMIPWMKQVAQRYPAPQPATTTIEQQ